ncbi:hypothetical protein HYW75_03235 [Candidatus Pacearchaeota archaeon]|nr:hypothetical protein [Candidatus Pacearchaeota archaeon]
MAHSAVSNTGPILHLTEINLINALNIFSTVFIPEEVALEVNKNKVSIPKKIKIIMLKSDWKNTAKILSFQYELDLGESEAIALALQEKIDYFLTDDLEARRVSTQYNLEAHGTAGIVLRAFKEKIIDKKMAIEKIISLYKKSSLFITQDIVEKIIRAINEFARRDK